MQRNRSGTLLAMAVGLAGGSPAAAVDVFVAALEITQGIQYLPGPSIPPAGEADRGGVPLVAGRTSVVRATLGFTGSAVPVAGIGGQLSLSVNAGPTTSFPPDQALFTAPLGPQRSNETDTLNFYLPGVQASTNVDIVVTVTLPGDTNAGNNSMSLSNLTFTAPVQPKIYFTGINYPTASLAEPALADIQRGRGDAMLRAIFPLSDADNNLYLPGLFSSLTFVDQWGNFTSIDGLDAMGLMPGKDVDKLLSLLESCRDLIVTGGTGATSRVFLYGWFRDNPIDANGWAGGCVGFGNTAPDRFQRTFAHEFMHMCRWPWHSPDTATLGLQVGWDVGRYLPGKPSSNNVTGAAKAMSLRDISVPDKLTSDAWIDDGTFQWFQTNGFSCAPGAAAEPDLGVDVLTIQGSFNSEGTILVDLEPVFRYPWLVEPTPVDAQGPYRVEVTSMDGEVVTRHFDALLGHDGSGPDVRGFFAVRVPLNGAAEVLLIKDPISGVEYGRRVRSPVPPTIVLTSPAPGSQLDGVVTVAWDPLDPDTPASEIRYQAAYSPDGGVSFVPLVVDFEAIVFAFDTGVVPQTEGPGTGLIRVFASDGLNTVFADVVGLTVAGRLPRFVRGDANDDGDVNLSDCVFILVHLFIGGAEPPCLATADTDADGGVDLGSAIYLLNYLFTGGPAPPEPFVACDYSALATDAALGCAVAPLACR